MNIHELRKKIKEYADAYYNEDAPLVTDEEYDALMHELRRLEAEIRKRSLLTAPHRLWAVNGYLVSRSNTRSPCCLCWMFSRIRR